MNNFGIRLTDRRARVLLDMDNVLFDFNKNFVKVYNKIYGTNVTADDLTTWDLSAILPGDTKGIYKRRGFFSNLEPNETVLEVVPRLCKDYEVYILSTGPRTAYAEKCDSLVKYFGTLFRDKFIYSVDKGVVLADFLLDDGYHNLQAFSKKIGTSVRYQRPHNVPETPEQASYDSVQNFYEFEQYLDEHAPKI